MSFLHFVFESSSARTSLIASIAFSTTAKSIAPVDDGADADADADDGADDGALAFFALGWGWGWG